MNRYTSQRTHSLVSRWEIIARVQLAVRVAVPDAKHALVLVWVIIHVDHDGGLGLGDLPTRDELAPAREEVDLRVDEGLELHDA